MINLDTNIRTQEERNEYVKEFDLSQCNSYELEKIADYILNGKDESTSSRNKGFNSETVMNKKCQREQFDEGDKGNIVDKEYITQTASTPIYKSKNDFTVTAKDAESDPIISDYWALYEKVSNFLKGGSYCKSWRILSNNKFSLMQDMKLVKSRNFFSAKSSSSFSSDVIYDNDELDFTDKNIIMSFIRQPKPARNLGNNFYHDYYLNFELLIESAGLTEEEKNTIRMIQAGFTNNEIVDMMGYPKHSAQQGKNTYLSNAVKKIQEEAKGNG